MQRATPDPAVFRDFVVEPEPFRLGRTPPRPDRPAIHGATALWSEPAMDVGQLVEQARKDAHDQGRRAALEEFHEREERLCAEAEEAARATGYEHGIDQARAEAQAAMETAHAALQAEWRLKFERLDNMLVEGAQQVSARMVAAEDDIVALSFEAVASVLGEVLTTAVGLKSTVANLIAQHGRHTPFKVHVNPLDWAEVSGDPSESLDAISELDWTADPEVAMGGLVLHHPHGSLNASLGAILQNLQSTLLQVRARRRSAARAAERSAQAEDVAS